MFNLVKKIAVVLFFVPSIALAQSTYQPFGNGYITNTPGQPSTTIQPFGNGWITNQ